MISAKSAKDLILWLKLRQHGQDFFFCCDSCYAAAAFFLVIFLFFFFFSASSLYKQLVFGKTYHLVYLVLKSVVQDLRCGYKELLDVLASQGRSLEMESDVAIRFELLDSIQGHCPLLFLVFLISH